MCDLARGEPAPVTIAEDILDAPGVPEEGAVPVFEDVEQQDSAAPPELPTAFNLRLAGGAAAGTPIEVEIDDGLMTEEEEEEEEEGAVAAGTLSGSPPSAEAARAAQAASRVPRRRRGFALLGTSLTMMVLTLLIAAVLVVARRYYTGGDVARDLDLGTSAVELHACRGGTSEGKVTIRGGKEATTRIMEKFAAAKNKFTQMRGVLGAMATRAEVVEPSHLAAEMETGCAPRSESSKVNA